MIPSFTLGVPMVPTSAPFLIVPSNHSKSKQNHSSFAHYTPSFPVSVGTTSNQNSTGTRVAHNNAHHLHSIPPAQKSTKSMILDHLLHLHADARLAQVSAQLGLDAMGELAQEGLNSSEKLCDALRYGVHGHSAPLTLRGATEGPSARAAMARADGLEKVIGAMLDNGASNTTLPESVRFRIELGMLIDDLVAFKRVDSVLERESTPNIPPSLVHLSRPRRESSSNGPATPSIFTSHSWAQPLGIVGSTLVREPPRPKDHFSTGVGVTSARCTRHLVQSCHRCASVPKRTPSSTGIGAGLTSRRLSLSSDQNGATGTLESIPHFLQLSAQVCTRLSQSQAQQQRKRRHDSLDDSVSFASTSTSSFGSSESGTPHPASSAGDMPIEEEEHVANTNPKKRSLLPSLFARGSNPYLHHQRSGSRASMDVDESDLESVTPTREWYALLAGLLTRAVLEGYLLRGWTGTHAAEVLFGVGLDGGKKKKANGKSSFFVWKGVDQQQQQQPQQVDSEKPAEVETGALPDGMLSMEEVGSVLFGSGTAFQEYAAEMEKRCAEFTTIASQTPDLVSHLDTLVRAYPLEPIQTAAFRFCEAISQWKQTPELDNYKTNVVNASPSFSSRAHRSSNDYTSSPSIQSHSPMLQQTPTKQRVRLSPSISIASLIHPSSSPPLSVAALSHPPSSSDSVSFLGLSNGSISTDSQPSISVIPAPLDRFFTTLGATSSENGNTASVVSIGTKMRLGWAGLTLGAKRPREKEGDAWAESERAPKKAFLKGGMFNS